LPLFYRLFSISTCCI